MSGIIVSPSILSADFANLEKEIRRVEKAGADWIHVDVMDGHFVPNITIGVPVVASLRKVTDLPLDVHLMIDNPEKYIEPFARAGANIFTFHYEAVDAFKISRLVRKIHSSGMKAGVAIKPKMPADVLLPCLEYVDMVLVMTVEPGFGGQEFMPGCAYKIKGLREVAPNLIIQVDGGINEETAEICKRYGANSIVAGSYIYKSDNIEKAIKSLK